MTRLFNLESYVDCCHYAGLFNQSNEQLIPPAGDLPTAYKTLLQNYINHPYLPQVNTGVYPQSLTINSSLNYLLIGTEIEQGDKQRLFIIRDTVDLMTLSTSDILNHQDGYLYSSAYHYWNHYVEISRYNLTKPLVFIDLDSFTNSHLIPVNTSPSNSSNYRVPVLNTKNQSIINFNYNAIQTYNNICKHIARYIIDEHFPAVQNHGITHLANYLQKISLFQLLQQYIYRDSFELIVEILYHSQVFYKRVTLSLAKIAEIVSIEINALYLNQVAKTYPEYQFILVSQYNIFPQIQQLLPDFICLNSSQEFSQIWQAKTQLKFPLFGIYLDNIEFAVGMLDEQGKPSKQWIQLSNQEDAISYEGKPTVLIGCIPSKNQEFFRISPQKTARLPIRVNGNDYCKNGIPQDYSIKIENPQGTEDVCIRIEFHLQPGSSPELKVTDLEGKYKITASLEDRKKSSYSHIPLDKIINTRSQNSRNQIERLKRNESHFKEISQLATELSKLKFSGSQVIKYQNVKDLLKSACQQIHSTNNSFDLLQFVDISSHDPIVNRLNAEFQHISFQKIADIIAELLNSKRNELSLLHKDLLAEAIMFTGKTYKFSHHLLPLKLFSQTNFALASKIRHRNLGNEYLQCLARIAATAQFQQKYFSWFNSYYKLETTKYLWGYSRILLWYYNFDSSVTFLNYKLHFQAIAEYLLTKPYSNFNPEYKQNAFLSLLYLLTFRANDKTFCQPGSVEMQIAEKVVDCFKDDNKIISRYVSREKSLNQFLQEMIEGTATEDDIDSIVRAG